VFKEYFPYYTVIAPSTAKVIALSKAKMIAILKFLINPMTAIALLTAKMIALLKFNQEEGDRINKHLKNQIITVNNDQFGASHFINAPYKISDRTVDVPKKAFMAVLQLNQES
jgi:hypothetical protein